MQNSANQVNFRAAVNRENEGVGHVGIQGEITLPDVRAVVRQVALECEARSIVVDLSYARLVGAGGRDGIEVAPTADGPFFVGIVVPGEDRTDAMLRYELESARAGRLRRFFSSSEQALHWARLMRGVPSFG